VVAARGGNTMVHRAFTTSLRQAPTTCRSRPSIIRSGKEKAPPDCSDGANVVR